MSLASSLDINLPEKFVVEANPKLIEIRLEFKRDHKAKGIVHRVPFNTKTIGVNSKNGHKNGNGIATTNGNGVAIKSPMSIKEESMNSIQVESPDSSTSNKTPTPQEPFKAALNSESKKNKIDFFSLTIGAVLGSIFLGYLLGINLLNKEWSGYIGGVISFIICIVCIYFAKYKK